MIHDFVLINNKNNVELFSLFFVSVTSIMYEHGFPFVSFTCLVVGRLIYHPWKIALLVSLTLSRLRFGGAGEHDVRRLCSAGVRRQTVADAGRRQREVDVQRAAGEGRGARTRAPEGGEPAPEEAGERLPRPPQKQGRRPPNGVGPVPAAARGRRHLRSHHARI